MRHGDSVTKPDYYYYSFMKPLSVYYDDCIRVWLRNHPGLLVGLFQIAALFGTAYIRAATRQTAINGYGETGISP